MHGAQQVRAERDLDSGAVRELQHVQPWFRTSKTLA
jgi:hypothetical protein